jgi:hypothetical protein
MMNNVNKLYLILGILFLIIPMVLIISFPKQVVDDSYILFRYAENFKNGNGLVWNRGEYLEAYTGILALILLIISPLDFILTTQLVGIISFFLGGIILYLLTKESSIKWLILICYMFAPAIYIHVFSGLETCLFMTLSLISIYFWKEEKEYYLLASLSLLTLTRPEGLLLAILLLLKKKNYKSLLIYLLFVGVYIILKYIYYGDVLPNSFYYKSEVTNRLSENWQSFKKFLLIYLLIPVFVICYGSVRFCYNFILSFKAPQDGKNFYISFCLTVVKKIKDNNWKYIFGLLILIGVIYYYLHCRLDTNYAYRFYFHVYPLILLIAFSSAKKINKCQIILLIIIQLGLYGFTFEKELKSVEKVSVINKAARCMGEYIKKNYSPKSKLAVYYDAGAIPFIAKTKTLDLAGLLNKDIAMFDYKNRNLSIKLRDNVDNIAYYKTDQLFLKYNPDIMVFNSSTTKELRKDYFVEFLKTRTKYCIKENIWEKPLEIFHDYKFVKSFGEDKYFYLLFERKKK